jgi:hypothetical protein
MAKGGAARTSRARGEASRTSKSRGARSNSSGHEEVCLTL